MDVSVPFAPVIQWVITLGVSFALGIGGIVWMLLKQATNRFAADAASLRDQISRHTGHELALLQRVMRESAETDGRVNVLHQRIEKLDGRLTFTPSIDSVHQVNTRIEQLNGTVQALKSELAGLRDSVGAQVKGVGDIMVRIEDQLARHDNALLIERRGQ